MGDLPGTHVATFDDRRVNFAAAIIILACSIECLASRHHLATLVVPVLGSMRETLKI